MCSDGSEGGAGIGCNLKECNLDGLEFSGIGGGNEIGVGDGGAEVGVIIGLHGMVLGVGAGVISVVGSMWFALIDTCLIWSVWALFSASASPSESSVIKHGSSLRRPLAVGFSASPF